MEGMVKGLLYGILGLVIFAIVANIGISIYEPYAVKNAIKATTNYTQTVDGVEYTFTGSGQSPQEAGQEARDSVNLVRTTLNVVLGIVFLVLVIFSAFALFKTKRM